MCPEKISLPRKEYRRRAEVAGQLNLVQKTSISFEYSTDSNVKLFSMSKNHAIRVINNLLKVIVTLPLAAIRVAGTIALTFRMLGVQ